MSRTFVQNLSLIRGVRCCVFWLPTLLVRNPSLLWLKTFRIPRTFQLMDQSVCFDQQQHWPRFTLLIRKYLSDYPDADPPSLLLAPGRKGQDEKLSRKRWFSHSHDSSKGNWKWCFTRTFLAKEREAFFRWRQTRKFRRSSKLVEQILWQVWQNKRRFIIIMYL